MTHIQLNIFITSGYFFSPEIRHDVYVTGICLDKGMSFQKMLCTELKLLEGEVKTPTSVYRRVKAQERMLGL